MNKYGFTLHIQYKDGFDWYSPYAAKLADRLKVYDPFQLRPYVPLAQVAKLLIGASGYESI
jgi:hypothetical protein